MVAILFLVMRNQYKCLLEVSGSIERNSNFVGPGLKKIQDHKVFTSVYYSGFSGETEPIRDIYVLYVHIHISLHNIYISIICIEIYILYLKLL